MKPLPIAIPSNRRIVVSQIYGDTSKIDKYKEAGINIPFHNGLDLCVTEQGLYNGRETYGTALVCPVDNAHLDKVWWDNPMSTKGNGIQISWKENGKKHSIIFWHCSELMEQQTYNTGEVLGYVGNSGFCMPSPTYSKPYDGSHLHLGLYIDGVLTDPETYFDRTKWFTKADNIFKDFPPLVWVLEWMKTQLNKLKVV